MDALRGFALLLQACGGGLSRLFSQPIPGPVIGLPLNHLSLFFVPAGVGVIAHLDLVSAYGARLLAVVVLSTWAGLAVAALTLLALLRGSGRERGHE